MGTRSRRLIWALLSVAAAAVAWWLLGAHATEPSRRKGARPPGPPPADAGVASLGAESRRRLPIVPFASPTITVRCVDEQSNPVADVSVLGGDIHRRTSADGRCAVPLGTTDLLCVHPDYVSARAELASAQDGQEVTVTLSAGETLRGVVRDEDGRPVGNLPLVIQTGHCPIRPTLERGTGADVRAASRAYSREVVCAADGSFEIHGLTPGTHLLAVDSDDWVPLSHLGSVEVTLPHASVEIDVARVYVWARIVTGAGVVPSKDVVSVLYQAPPGLQDMQSLQQQQTNRVVARLRAMIPGCEVVVVRARRRAGLSEPAVEIRVGIKVGSQPMQQATARFVPLHSFTAADATTIDATAATLLFGTAIVRAPYPVDLWTAGDLFGAARFKADLVQEGTYTFRVLTGEYVVRLAQPNAVDPARWAHRVRVTPNETTELDLADRSVPCVIRVRVVDAGGCLTNQYALNVTNAARTWMVYGHVLGSEVTIPAEPGVVELGLVDFAGHVSKTQQVTLSPESPVQEVTLTF